MGIEGKSRKNHSGTGGRSERPVQAEGQCAHVYTCLLGSLLSQHIVGLRSVKKHTLVAKF